MMLHNLAPLWDEALESLLADAALAKPEGLQVADLQALSLENAIRIGDILESLLLMTLYGHWVYVDENDDPLELAQAEIDQLFANGRVRAEDLQHLAGVWKPRQ